MKIAVILKQVPDTEARIIKDPGNPVGIIEDDIKFVLNPFDEYAVEEALAIKEAGDAETIGVCIGREQAEKAIRSALAMGIDRAIHITDPDAVAADVITQSRILAEAIRSLDVDIILCGKEWIDTADEAAGAAIAHYLDYPHVLNVEKFELESGKAKITREVDGGSLEIETSLPVVISCSKNLNEPRYPTLIAIKRSKRKEIKTMSLSELGVDVGTPAARVVAFHEPPARAAGKVVTGEPADVVSEAIQWLSEEAKVI